jgi:tRNA G18 (ribose-2'-O)-methylase SpoU
MERPSIEDTIAIESAGPEAVACHDQNPPKSRFYIICHNVAKKHNVGTLARCATAFGAESMILIGSRQFNTHGSHGSDVHVRFEHFETLERCRENLMNERKCSAILGVEIVSDARAIETHPFDGDTAFIMGNEVRSF